MSIEMPRRKIAGLGATVGTIFQNKQTGSEAHIAAEKKLTSFPHAKHPRQNAKCTAKKRTPQEDLQCSLGPNKLLCESSFCAQAALAGKP